MKFGFSSPTALAIGPFFVEDAAKFTFIARFPGAAMVARKHLLLPVFLAMPVGIALFFHAQFKQPTQDKAPSHSTRERLVGRWLAKGEENPPFHSSVRLFAEFTADGAFSFHISADTLPLIVKSGRFEVEGNRITFTVGQQAIEEHASWSVDIESLSANRLVVRAVGAKAEATGEDRSVFNREP